MRQSGDTKYSKKYLATVFAVGDALRKLGDTPREVGDKLQAMGIKGSRQRCTACPLTMYLWGKGFTEAKVHVYHVEIPVEGMDNISMGMPAPVMRFVEAFDQGLFKGLIADGEK